jgi:hypothetical protein
MSNVERVLRYRSVNGQLFAQLLKRDEFFQRKAPLLAALGNPKCDQSFADAHLRSLEHRELERLSLDVGANPVVRMRAKSLVARPGGAR